MSITTVPDARNPVAAGRRTTFVQALRSEWTKLRTLRSTAYTLLSFVVIGVGIAILMSAGAADDYRVASASEQAAFDPTGTSLFAVMLAQLAIVVLGVLVVTSEYASGTIQASLAAVPRRGRLLAAKAVAFGAVALATGLATGFGMFFAGQAVFATQGVPQATLDQPGVLRAVLGAGLYLTAVGLLAVAVGILIRATAGGISVMVAGVLLLPNLSQLLPESWADQVQKLWPTLAGLQITTVEPDPDTLAPWLGFAVMCAFVAAALAAATVAFRERDA